MLLLPINEQFKELQSWQQSVFCMALAQRSLLHFHLFCEAINSEDGNEIDKLNQLFWEKMTVKGAKINFTIQQEFFDSLIPDARDFDFYGVYPAIDHCVILSCAFNSFLSKSKDEAINASQTSFATIASFIELQNDSEVVAFQTELLEKLNVTRSPDVIKAIREFVLSFAKTNLGISLTD